MQREAAYLEKAVGEARGLVLPLTLFGRLLFRSPQVASPSTMHTGMDGRYRGVRGSALAKLANPRILAYIGYIPSYLGNSLALKVEHHQGPDLISQRDLRPCLAILLVPHHEPSTAAEGFRAAEPAWGGRGQWVPLA